jgi:hypothetical protein
MPSLRAGPRRGLPQKCKSLDRQGVRHVGTLEGLESASEGVERTTRGLVDAREDPRRGRTDPLSAILRRRPIRCPIWRRQ